jgi:ribonucleoside-diphosphate reductase alpha chain
VPKEATVEEITQAYIQSWKLGAKRSSIYRDLQQADAAAQHAERRRPPRSRPAGGGVDGDRPVRRKLPDERHAITHKFDIQANKNSITVGCSRTASRVKSSW